MFVYIINTAKCTNINKTEAECTNISTAKCMTLDLNLTWLKPKKMTTHLGMVYTTYRNCDLGDSLLLFYPHYLKYIYFPISPLSLQAIPPSPRKTFRVAVFIGPSP
jgi:hypothetical protein